MVDLVFETKYELGMKLRGSISVPLEAAKTIATDRASKTGFVGDRELLEWMNSVTNADDRVIVPADKRDRMDYVVADLIDCQGDVAVSCRLCKSCVVLPDITIEEKDFSTETSSMRMGFAGNLYSCPNNHGLLFVVTKIF
ncbi:hypothetical protein [Aeoliella sp.]|uniref:hypothetical protein n=1 Tax=Aeoliella sp. TaxID=2795800 RepID=UPI003CCB8638